MVLMAHGRAVSKELSALADQNILYDARQKVKHFFFIFSYIFPLKYGTFRVCPHQKYIILRLVFVAPNISLHKKAPRLGRPILP